MTIVFLIVLFVVASCGVFVCISFGKFLVRYPPPVNRFKFYGVLFLLIVITSLLQTQIRLLGFAIVTQRKIVPMNLLIYAFLVFLVFNTIAGISAVRAETRRLNKKLS